MSYEWKARAFVHQGRCDLCAAWTRGGVRLVGRMRYAHLCADCAQNRFAGEIGLHDPWSDVAARQRQERGK